MSKAALLINQIRQRPALYLGTKSLTAFYHFLRGYWMACQLHEIDDDDGLNIPQDFNDWVAYRTHFHEPTSGWCNMIVSNARSEEEAFDRFFELLEEHSRRVPRLVAEILNPISNWRTTRNGTDFLIPPPKRVQLVKYTNDPGFFALHESEDWPDRFHPYLSWMGPEGGQPVIHDEESYREMVCENE